MALGTPVCSLHRELETKVNSAGEKQTEILRRIGEMQKDLRAGLHEFTNQAVEIAKLKEQVGTLRWLAYTTIAAFIIEGAGIVVLGIKMVLSGGLL